MAPALIENHPLRGLGLLALILLVFQNTSLALLIYAAAVTPYDPKGVLLFAECFKFMASWGLGWWEVGSLRKAIEGVRIDLRTTRRYLEVG